ncbi:hypothetical protein OB03_14020 [Brevundimonas sp. GN22]
MDKPTATVPVVHLSEAGIHDLGNPLAAPCVEILYSFRLDMLRSQRAEGRTYALIDTGADVSVIAPHLIPPHAQLEKEMPSLSIAGVGTTTVYRVEISFVGSPVAFTTQVARGPVGIGRAYSMIIGRSLLQATRFVYDRRNGISALDIFNSE